MKIKKAIFSIFLCGAFMSSNAAADNYYSDANLRKLTAEGIRKHAPLAIIIDQKNQENPNSKKSLALTLGFAEMLKLSIGPIIVSHSVAYNYFVRRERAGQDDKKIFESVRNPVDFDNWHLYTTHYSNSEMHESSFLVFIPDQYLQHYKDNLGLNMDQLIAVKDVLPTGIDSTKIIEYIKTQRAFVTGDHQIPFLINNLRAILTTIKPEKLAEFTLQERKQKAQLPIWDILLYGHGSDGVYIGGISGSDIQKLLTFFNDELNVGIFYINSCSAGGKNLNLLEFEDSIGNKTLRTLDYIVIVGSISDQPTFHDTDILGRLHSAAADFQNKGEALDKLLLGLNRFYRHAFSVHGASRIPQVWLPGGLGFQTFQIDAAVQVLGNVKVHAHEDEQRPITLPDTTRAALLYAQSIGVPLLVPPTYIRDDQELDIRRGWKNTPNFAELIASTTTDDMRAIYDNPDLYPAIAHIKTLGFNEYDALYSFNKDAIRWLYPEFISMLRGDSKQHFSKIEIQQPQGDVKKFAGVLNFIRDAFFDIARRASTKTFFIDELVGNNDISLILELTRGRDKAEMPSELEMELRPYIDQIITLKSIELSTNRYRWSLTFEFNNKVWVCGDFGNLSFGSIVEDDMDYLEGYSRSEWYHDETAPFRKKEYQKPISEILKKKAAFAVIQRLESKSSNGEEVK